MGSKDFICITLDIDWAKDEIIEPVIEMMKQANVKATLFATHQSSLLTNLDANQFEVGLHPNFTNGDFRQTIYKLKGLYPQAQGGRSHSLFVSSHILQLYMECGLKYESNIFLLWHENLHPAMRFRHLVSIPFYWSDDKHISLYGSFELDGLRLEAPGLKVYNFHPIHVLTNPSIGKLFQSLLDYLVARPTYTLYEIYRKYVAEHEWYP